MSAEAADRQQQKVREFMNLLPLTLAISGVPDAAPNTFFSESQMESRATTIRLAYKIARQLILEVVK
ncbi:MAG: hypothetical protein L0Y72_25190 [Gemmataceae bacterium]|nr:hypothetical protein [Gemmataceae bacterium]MCI0742340.1 hypothetical protein [Gemmataceae bacterium]